MSILSIICTKSIMVYKDENNINIINSYKLFFNTEEEKINHKIWVEKTDAILVDQYNDNNISLIIQRYNDIKIVHPIHYSSIGKTYKDYKIHTIHSYEIIRIV